MIQEAYCSYEVSKLLKEKGFDIPVRFEHHCVYNLDQKPQFHRLPHNFNGNEYSGLTSQWYSAPTHQMAMAWLREEKGIYLDVFIDDDSEMPWTYNIHKELRDGTTECVCHHHGNYYPLQTGYEEAVEAALKYTLEKLI